MQCHWERIVQLSANGSLFTIAHVTLTLQNNVTLTGRTNNNASLININSGTFRMNGGEISGNTSSLYGGGVYVSGGTFTKTATGGVIYGNYASPASLTNNAYGSGDTLYRESGSKKWNSTISANMAFDSSTNIGW